MAQNSKKNMQLFNDFNNNILNFISTKNNWKKQSALIRSSVNSNKGVLDYLSWNFNDFWGGGKVRTTISPTRSSSIYRASPTMRTTTAEELTTELQTTATTTTPPLRNTVKTGTTKSSGIFIPTYFPVIL